MQAVVLDITDGEATVMTKNGDIIGVDDLNYEIGQEIEIEEKPVSSDIFKKKMKKRISALSAAAAALLVIIGGGSYIYMKPYGTVSLDVNPSIEYTINRFDRVLGMTGVNDDGYDILSKIKEDNLINKDIESAVEETITQIMSEGYLSDDNSNYIIVTANTEKEAHTEELVDKLDRMVAGYENVNPIISKVSVDDIEEAHDQGMTAGKKMIIDHLESISDGGIDRNDWVQKSVKDIAGEYYRIKNDDNKPQPESISNPATDEPAALQEPPVPQNNDVSPAPIQDQSDDRPEAIKRERDDNKPRQTEPENEHLNMEQHENPSEDNPHNSEKQPGENAFPQERGNPGSSR